LSELDSGAVLEELPETLRRRPGGRHGLFVTFEGVEGSGKSTQIRRLRDRLVVQGREVVLTREPGGTEIGRKLRAVLLGSADPPVCPVAEAMLYAADRAQHLTEIVEPALERGAVVLSDRFLDASLAYQGYARGLGCETILRLHRQPPLDRRPDRTILLDLEADRALARARSRNETRGSGFDEGRFEAESTAFHERVRDGYLLLAGQEPDRFRVLDASGPEDEVERRIWDAVRDLVAPGR
jgi:dTMP kinase